MWSGLEEKSANYKSVNKIRAQDAEGQVENAGDGSLPAKAGCLHKGLHADAEEAELGDAQGGTCTSDERFRGYGLYTG